jgi:hypothetical protein
VNGFRFAYWTVVVCVVLCGLAFLAENLPAVVTVVVGLFLLFGVWPVYEQTREWREDSETR